MLDRLRYFLAVYCAILLPLGVLFWFVIHPWARLWRRLGPTRTYLIVIPPLIACAAVIFRARAWLYLLMLLVVPAGLVMVVFEERELVGRFGDDYRKYQREVPRFIPRWRSRPRAPSHR
jgi:steroid 5-alpha reductase family enzyme